MNEERLAEALDRIGRERAAFLSDVEGLSQAQLDFKPSAGAWSIGEVMEHVGLSEQMLHDNVKELVQRGKRKEGFTREISYRELPMQPRMIPEFLLRFDPFLIPISIMNNFVPRAVQSFVLANSVFKVRTAPNLEPTPGIPGGQRLAKLRAIRETTLQLMESAKSMDLSRLRWKHPLMGTHDVYGTLELLANHDRRHRQQIETIRRNPRFPAA